jgi:diamine N-acetyltransferase
MVQLLPLTRHTWELQVAEDQQGYIPANLFSIAQASFEQSELFAIYHQNTVVGFLALATYAQIPWVTRIMIDARYQGQGYGKATLAAIVPKLLSRPGVHEVRTSISSSNAAAEYLFAQAGFVRSGDIDEREFVMIRESKTASERESE